ncbi:MAG: 2-oxoglutarate dehydrogenase complex dihydrolipoyllysine-residue succinyltransferase [Gemmataceae bacterium]
MAVVEIKLTPAGESVTHATMLKWFFPDGAYVKRNSTVCELETDKVTKEEYAPADGVLTIIVPPDTKVPIGTVLGHIDTSAPAPVPPAPTTPAPVSATPAAPTAPTGSTAPAGPAAPAAPQPVSSLPPLSPAASVMAATQGIDVSKVTPADKRVITKSDLIAHQEAANAVKTNGIAALAVAPEPPLVAKPAGGIRRQPMSAMRQRIAERLLEAQQNAAILTTFNEADMSRVMELRAKYKESFQKKHGVGLGFMSFFVKAAVSALQAFPAVNAFIDGSDIVFHDYTHIGVAVSTDKGLMVPVLRNCESLSFADIEKGIVALANKAREGKISLADLQGGTFTITNGGIFGSMMSTPILNPPQSAILGMHAITKRAVVVDDQIVIRPMMYLALSYDHRIIDGKEAVSFLVRIKEAIENPERLLLEV